VIEARADAGEHPTSALTFSITEARADAGGHPTSALTFSIT
jgi:hypothetical protein